MLSVSNLSKSYGNQTLFHDINFNVSARDRIAIIGRNGTGKTTLFEVLAGNLTPDSGSISMLKGTTTGYLEQDTTFSSEQQLLDHVACASTQISGLSHRIQILQEELAAGVDEGIAEGLMRELGELQYKYEAAGGYNTKYEAKIILSGLGFAESDYHRPLSEFSGGWLMRAALAKLLLLNPDLLLLDEPTNHLDLEACIWFEEYLKTYQGAAMVTSHDRAFLNRVAGKVIAIEQGEVIFHQGNYDSFIVARQRDLAVREATAKRQDLKIQKETRFIERFRADKRRAAQVQSRINRLEKLERVVVPRSTRKVRITFPEPVRSGEDVIALKNIAKSYGSNMVYRDLNLVLNRGDRVALVGHNGAGKTTLLKVLAGVLPFDEGERKLGYNVSVSYYAQHQLDLLDPDNTVLTELWRVAPNESEERMRGILGTFLFSGDDVYKKISVLSGGEKSRLAIAKMLVRPANFLLMDEPTNHLDIPSREILTDALQSYRGTLCFITHDRTLIQQVANKMLEIKSGEVRLFPGDYASFLDWKKTAGEMNPEASRSVSRNGPDKNSSRNKLRERKRIEGELRNEYSRKSTPLKKRIAAIEADLTRLEAQFEQVEKLLADPEHYGDKSRVMETIDTHRVLKERITSLTAEWEELLLELESINREFDEAKEQAQENQGSH